MSVTVMAWGYKHGEPPKCDFEFSLKKLRNPYRLLRLRHLTGHDARVREDVWSSDAAEEHYQHCRRAVKHVTLSEDEVVVVFGCHAGRHRSVTFARRLFEDLDSMGVTVRLETPFALQSVAEIEETA